MAKDLYEEFHKDTRPLSVIPKNNHFTYKHLFRLLDNIALNEDKVLDVGCGAGVISTYLSDKVKSVLGVDISEKSIASCNKTKNKFKLKNVEYIHGNIEDIDIRDKFDVVIMSELIEHVKNDKALTKKANKLLKKGGYLVVTTPSFNAPLYRMGFLKKFDKRVGHLRRYTDRRLKNLLTSNGFRVKVFNKEEGLVRNSLFNFKIFSLVVRAANKFSILGNMITMIDNISIRLFGESDLQVVAVKK